jgi:hypothetical protein
VTLKWNCGLRQIKKVQKSFHIILYIIWYETHQHQLSLKMSTKLTLALRALSFQYYQ